MKKRIICSVLMITISLGYDTNGEESVVLQTDGPIIFSLSNVVAIAQVKDHKLPRLLEDGFQTITQKVETIDYESTLVRSRGKQSVPVRFVTIAPLNAINAETLVGIEILLPDSCRVLLYCESIRDLVSEP